MIKNDDPCNNCPHKHSSLKEQLGICVDPHTLEIICDKLNSALTEALKKDELIHGNYKDVEYLYKETHKLNEDIARANQYDGKTEEELMAEDEKIANILKTAGKDLTEKEAEIFYKVFRDGIRIVAIAKKHNVSHQAVSKVYHKAIKKIGKRVAEFPIGEHCHGLSKNKLTERKPV